jgi:hypothetical protein
MKLTSVEGGHAMPNCWSVVRSRAGFIFGGAAFIVLVLPVNAFAIAVHMPKQHARSVAVSALDLVLILGGLAAVLLVILAASRLATSEPLSARPTRRAAVE